MRSFDPEVAGPAVHNPSSCSATLSSSNVGFRLLQKAGWREGSGLGAAEQGRLEPVDVFIKHDKGGIGAKAATKKLTTISRSAPEMLKAKGTEGKRVMSKKARRKLRKESKAERRMQEQFLQRELFMAFWPDNV